MAFLWQERKQRKWVTSFSFKPLGICVVPAKSEEIIFWSLHCLGYDRHGQMRGIFGTATSMGKHWGSPRYFVGIKHSKPIIPRCFKDLIKQFYGQKEKLLPKCSLRMVQLFSLPLEPSVWTEFLWSYWQPGRVWMEVWPKIRDKNGRKKKGGDVYDKIADAAWFASCWHPTKRLSSLM
jgi:hypothetical protein